MEDQYTKPQIEDYGSLEELTLSCDFPGAGDQAFPDTMHTRLFVSSTDFCASR